MTYWEFFKTVFYDIFVASLGATLAVFAAESFSKGIVTSIINITTLLFVCGISGILVVLFPPQKRIGGSKLEYVYAVIFALLAGSFAFQALGKEQAHSPLLAIAMSLIVFFFLLSSRLPVKES